jgi:hypothetical protein
MTPETSHEQTLAERVQRVQLRIAAACQLAGRNLEEVRLVAVSKTRPASDILAAFEAGVQHFGENRVEEAVIKIPQTAPANLNWHMIGHIQSRKARDVIGPFSLIHSVDRPDLAEKLSRLAVERQVDLPVLVQINISGEASKSGLNAVSWRDDSQRRHDLWDAIRSLAALPGLQVRGLMTLAPIVAHMEETRPVFKGLAALRDALCADLTIDLAELSMGMTDDYPVAIEEGATLVRIGRAIFGER